MDASRSTSPSAASRRTAAAVTTLVVEPALNRASGSAARPLARSRTPELPCQEPSVPPSRTSAAVASLSGSPSIASHNAWWDGAVVHTGARGAGEANAGAASGPAPRARTREAASRVIRRRTCIGCSSGEFGGRT
ncbi:hypothetical protein RKD28_002019 [Streptomyces sp. SAI-229]